jgi:hypothetical protein
MNPIIKSASKFIIEKLGNIEVKVRPVDNYLFATDLCKAGGKEWKAYYRNEFVKDYINKLSSDMGIPMDVLIQSKKGGIDQGTWIHPKVAIHLAQWISADFAVSVSKWVDNWINQSASNKDEFINALQNIKPSYNNQKELEIKNKLQQELLAYSEVKCDSGKIDLLTNDKIIEIKEASNWKHAIGQIMIYGLEYPDKQKMIYLFGECDRELIKSKCLLLNIEVCFE